MFSGAEGELRLGREARTEDAIERYDGEVNTGRYLRHGKGNRHDTNSQDSDDVSVRTLRPNRLCTALALLDQISVPWHGHPGAEVEQDGVGGALRVRSHSGLESGTCG